MHCPMLTIDVILWGNAAAITTYYCVFLINAQGTWAGCATAPLFLNFAYPYVALKAAKG